MEYHQSQKTFTWSGEILGTVGMILEWDKMTCSWVKAVRGVGVVVQGGAPI